MANIWVNDLRSNFSTFPKFENYEQLKQVFNMEVLENYGWSVAKQGDEVVKLVGFEVKEGPAEYRPRVLGKNNVPRAKVVVFRSWPGAQSLPGEVRPPYSTKGVYGWTEITGEIGFPYSGGSVVIEGGGPDMIWPAIDPPGAGPQYADAVAKLGWIGGTDHMTANPIFQVTVKGDQVEPPPPPPPVEGEYELVIVHNGVDVARIPVIPVGSSDTDYYISLRKGGQEVSQVPTF